MKKLIECFFPERFRFHAIAPFIVFLVTFLLAEAVVLFALKKTFPSLHEAAEVAFLIAMLGAFFAPFAYLAACQRREPPLSLRPLLNTIIVFVLPVMVVELLFAVPSGIAVAALLHGLYVTGLVIAVWGIESFLQSLGLPYDFRRLLILLLLLIAMFDVILFNNVVEHSKVNRKKAITAILAVNPAMMTASAYNRDILRGRVLYNRSVIGQYYYFTYPSPVRVFLLLLAFGVLMGLGSAVSTLISKDKAMRNGIKPKDTMCIRLNDVPEEKRLHRSGGRAKTGKDSINSQRDSDKQ